VKDFDPDLSPYHQDNKEAAADHGLHYDPVSRVYRDEDGFPILDKFGQPLG